MRVVFFDQGAHQLGRIEAKIDRPQGSTKFEVSFLEIPFTQRAQLALGMKAKNRFANIEQIDAAGEFARAGFGGSMSALGDDAHDSALAAKQGENLGGFAVLRLAQTDATKPPKFSPC